MLPPLSRVGVQGTPPSSPLDFDYLKQWHHTLLSWSAGVITFPACIGLFQALIFRPLQISNATFGARVFGICSVGTAGVMASIGLLGTSAYLLKFGTDMTEAVVSSLDTRHILFNGVASAVWFYILGGRFHSVLPSSLVNPGAFANRGLTASFNYASNEKKKKLNFQGKQHGCHTCGRFWLIDKFIADHQPPLAVIRDMMLKRRYIFGIFPTRPKIPNQRFYPQCNQCSQKQQNYLSALSRVKVQRLKLKWRHIVTHGTSLRLYHVWLPFPFIYHMFEPLKG
ncbi:uncharacterized protein [Amphiura filiformis]|uniref:uncharacterized protein n=1 Tax=Amphiura filiformis TaxID=82378 RepID=UPI003B21CD1B